MAGISPNETTTSPALASQNQLLLSGQGQGLAEVISIKEFAFERLWEEDVE